jgi:Bacterial TniB protein
MLIIDEIHSMLAGTFREQRIFLNSIRFLANDLRLPLACVGTHEAKQALMTDQQLADRFEACELPALAGRCCVCSVVGEFRIGLASSPAF